jgi:hypothetical protein
MNHEERAFEGLDREIRKLELKRRRENPNWDLYPPDEAQAISLRQWRKLRDENPEHAAKIDAMIADIEAGRIKSIVSKMEE